MIKYLISTKRPYVCIARYYLPKHSSPKLVNASRAPMRCLKSTSKLQWFGFDDEQDEANGVVFSMVVRRGGNGPWPLACPFASPLFGVIWCCDMVDTFNGWIERLWLCPRDDRWWPAAGPVGICFNMNECVLCVMCSRFSGHTSLVFFLIS